jgi:hypothetical protein
MQEIKVKRQNHVRPALHFAELLLPLGVNLSNTADSIAPVCDFTVKLVGFSLKLIAVDYEL